MEQNTPKKPNSIDPVNKWRLASLAGEMGFIIALPLIAFGFIGKYLDSKYGTEPWLTLLGIGTAIAATTIWLTRRFKEMMKLK